ncbi:hypothetical protein J6590_086714 [Homalodisca vitripennis]|nr:hypothetical protein J6590_086714 [Homalodisca vitripennis]
MLCTIPGNLHEREVPGSLHTYRQGSMEETKDGRKDNIEHFLNVKKQTPKKNIKKEKLGITEKHIFSNNIYDVLRQDNDDNDEVGYVEDLGPKRKIIICSDSHGKGLAWHLNSKHSLNSVGFVRPGGRAEQILNMNNINGEVVSQRRFSSYYVGINNITNTLESLKEKKVILVDLPNRYDLAEWSCVNKETRKTNLVLKELSNGFGNVSLVEASVATKDMHTKHGMHFNAKGKDWLAGKIDEAVKSYSTRPPSAMDPNSAGEPSTEDMLQPTVETLTGNVQPPLHGHRIEEQTDSTHPNP